MPDVGAVEFKSVQILFAAVLFLAGVIILIQAF